MGHTNDRSTKASSLVKPTSLNLQPRPFAPLESDEKEETVSRKSGYSENFLEKIINTPKPELATTVQRKSGNPLKAIAAERNIAALQNQSIQRQESIEEEKSEEEQEDAKEFTMNPEPPPVQRKSENRLRAKAAERIAIQAKLAIGEPNDKYEQEADATAARVVQQINSSTNASTTSQNQPIQRQEMEEDEELQMKPLVQRRENLGGGEASTDLESSIQSARGSGQSLDANLQQAMGQAMGADFSGVKVHTDSQSDQLNKSIQAKAFTTGQDVFFRQGAYEPSSRGGQELIAHELTHVVQQNGGAVQRSDILQKKASKLVSVAERVANGVVQRAINPKSVQERQAFLDTYSMAATLVNGIDVNGTETQVLDQLVQNYINRSGFAYDMTPTSPTEFLNGKKFGDCSTLSKSFVIIAKEYFGISGIDTSSKGSFGVAGGGLVLDVNGATGNVNDGVNDGAHWAFTSHTWVVGPDRDRDILFRGATVNPSVWIDAGSEGEEDGIPYREFAGLGGGRVYTYRNVTSTLGNRYTIDLQTAKGAVEEDKQEMLKLYNPNKKKKGCFITTACVEAKGLPDDCEELTVLRQFRDDYMSSVENGSEMIDEYYAIAPEIVTRISALPNGELIFVSLYDKVAKSVHLVKAGQNEEAMQNYISIVRELKKQYLET
ncbi:DUF4157 domain-containing protein [Pseudanabaena sp. SR411]|uniref:eCIS core domain-containing protein n=1 Tax=Pseudanabaena sp. SR411 TaxID=1980935 RepID=UPI0020CC7C0A|nr:DUF4157 domain-containing protein [Pseudanabaena sp. SR411]